MLQRVTPLNPECDSVDVSIRSIGTLECGKLETLMKAVGYMVAGPIAEDAALVDIDLPRPVAAGCDLVVEVKAV